ncbi:MAG: glycosyltransferase family A protein [Terriglobales bacterium]|jgi:glycosyltransferase involved in cell wall biosynthesis
MSCSVSIIIPAYNAERWIASALESALNQTWPHKEIIVVDDGSSDNTFAAAEAYESGQLKVIRQQNLGAATARNTAVSQAQGDFIQYLDADDLLSANKVEEQVILLQSNPGYLAVSPAIYFFDGQSLDSGLEERSGVVDSDDPVRWLTELLGPDGPFGMVPYGAWLTPRHVAECAGPWDDSVRSPDDDGEYFARVVLASRGVRASKTGRYYYRKFLQGGSYSTTHSEALLRGRFHSLNCKAKWLLARTRDPRAYRALANRYMDLAFGSYPFFPGLTDEALRKTLEMGETNYRPRFGTWKGELLRRLVGWKATKRLNTAFHSLSRSLEH